MSDVYARNSDPAWRKEWFPTLNGCEKVHQIIEDRPYWIAVVGRESTAHPTQFFVLVCDEDRGPYREPQDDEWGYAASALSHYVGEQTQVTPTRTLFDYYKDRPDHIFFNMWQDEGYEPYDAMYDGEVIEEYGGILRVLDPERGEHVVVDYTALQQRMARTGGGEIDDNEAFRGILDLIKKTGRYVR